MATVPQGAAARFVGQTVLRKEDPRLLTGHGRYVDDVLLPGMLHAVFVRSPHARARIRSIDARAALELDGVVAVIDGPELHATLNPFPRLSPTYPEFFPLADGDVRFVGDPVAIVLAADRYVAEDAAELVDVDYEPLPPMIGHERALEDGAPLVHPDLGSNLAFDNPPGDDAEIDAIFAAADVVVEETFRQHRHTNVPMEGRGVVADWQPGEGSITMHVSSQNVHAARAMYATVLGVGEHQVRVTMQDVGGGFGQKIFVTREEAATAAASRHVGRPVKWVEDRQENLLASNHAREEHLVARIALTRDGIIQAMETAHVEDMGAYPMLPPSVTATTAALMFPGPYRVPRFRSHPRTVYTNTCGRGAYRGPWLYGDVVRECLLDVVAVRMAIDPAELRRRNLIAPDELPYTTPSGATYENVSIQETFDLALEMAGYEGFRARQAAARAEGRYLGIGISAYVEPCARGGGRGSLEVATIRVEPTGKVHVIMGTGSHGHSLETTMAQVVADHLGVDIDDITFLQGDTATAPHGGGTAGSRSAVVAGNAARRSAELLREKLLRIAAHMLEAAPEDLEAARGRIAVVGSPDASVSVAEVARTAYVNTLALPEDEEPGLDVTTRYTAPPVTWSNATHVCMVEVDPGTGLVRVEDFVVAEDCGIMINPMVVDGQIAGGVAQGIGGVLLEHLPYDAAGNPLAITLKDYLMPTADTMPDYRIGHIETPSATPGGHKGTGEGGTIGAPAAVMNAVLDALRPFGVEMITKQPLDPTRIMELVGAGPHAAAGAGGPASAPSRAHASG